MATQAGKQGIASTARPGPPPNYTASNDIEAVAGSTVSVSKTVKIPHDLAPAAAVREYIIAVLHSVYEVPRPQAVAAAAKWTSGLGAAFDRLGKREYIARFGEPYGRKLLEYRTVAERAIRDQEGPGCGTKLLFILVFCFALWGLIAICIMATAKKC